MTIEEHCSSWIEALGSVPKMCIMLSKPGQNLVYISGELSGLVC
jgi:hypothetical protein